MIVLYATLEKGEGEVIRLGSYDTLEDVKIFTGLFEKDVVLTMVEEREVKDAKMC